MMTTQKDDPIEWASGTATATREARIKDRFLDASDPLRFLVVTAKLLTGFDAPIEGVMYLDKPLRAHTLFQAVTRTNRRWTNPHTGQEKLYGLVVDYVGIGNELAKAVAVRDTGERKALPPDVEELVRGARGADRRLPGAVRGDRPDAAVVRAADGRAGAARDQGGARRVRGGVPALRGAVRVPVARHRACGRSRTTTAGSRRSTSRSSRPGTPTSCSGTGSARRPSSSSPSTSAGSRSTRPGSRRSPSTPGCSRRSASSTCSMPDRADPDTPPTVEEVLDTLEERLKRKLAGHAASGLAQPRRPARGAPPGEASRPPRLRRVPQAAPRPRPRAGRGREARRRGDARRVRACSPTRTRAPSRRSSQEYAPHGDPGDHRERRRADRRDRPARPRHRLAESQPGDREVRRQLRLVLDNNGLPPAATSTTGPTPTSASTTEYRG